MKVALWASLGLGKAGFEIRTLDKAGLSGGVYEVNVKPRLEFLSVNLSLGP